MTYSIVSNGSNGVAIITNAATGAYTYMPYSNASGTDSFTFKVNDGTTDSNTATITITITPVNDAPVSSNGTLSVNKNKSGSGTLSASDVDNTSLTYTLVTTGSKGTATITNAATGAFTYTPNTGETGTDSFTFKANDGTDDSNVATVTITINESEDMPIANSGTLNATEETIASGILTGSDANGDPLTYAVVANGTKGTAVVTNAATGAYTYTPKADVNGSDSFTFKVNDGKLDSNPATITVTIQAINDAPVAQNGTLATNEDTAATGTLLTTDVDGDALTYSIVANGTKGTATITNATTGAYSYTPMADANGTDSFTFKINDGKLDSNTATISVTINPVNDVPVAQDMTITTHEDTTTTGDLLASDVDGDALTYTITSNGTKGTATITDAATGSFRYVPNANAHGTDTISFKVNDGKRDSNVATITIIVAPVNDPPVAQNGTLATREETAITGTLLASDVDGDVLTYSIVANGGKGTATITNATTGAYSYVPNALAYGTDTITFQVNDGQADSNTAVVSVTITRNNTAPAATSGITSTALSGSDQSITLTGTDREEDPLKFIIESLPGHGQLYQTADGLARGAEITATGTQLSNSSGKVIYVSTSGWSGTDSFQFSASDGKLTSSATGVNVQVQAVNTALTLADIPNVSVKASLSNNTPVTVPFTVTTAKTTTSNLTFMVKSLNNDLVPDANIQVMTSTPTRLVIIPKIGRAGSAVITLTVSDGVTEPVSKSFTLTVELDIPTGTEQLSGVITNASGTGIANVLVRLLPVSDPVNGTTGDSLETLTDSSGRYRFIAKQGLYRLEFLTSYRDRFNRLTTLPGNIIGGFANGAGGVVNSQDAANVLQLADTTELKTTLYAGVMISGTVKTNDNKPVVGAILMIHNLDWSVVANVKSASDGSFSSQVRLGLEYRVQVLPAFCESSNTDTAQGCGTAWVDFLGGQWVQSGTTGETRNGTVTPGDDDKATKLKADGALVLAVKVDLGQKVTGRVVDGSGEGMAFAWVESPVGGVPTDANGTFTLTVPSGSLPSGFKLSIYPGGHEDPVNHEWIPGTAFTGGDVTGDVASGFTLTHDPTTATFLTSWPDQALGDADKKGLKIAVGRKILLQGSIQSSLNGVANIWVNAHAIDGAVSVGVSSKSDGTFTIPIPAPLSGVTVWYEVAPWSDQYLLPDPVMVRVTATGITGVYSIDPIKSVDANGMYKPVAGSQIGTATTVDFAVTSGTKISGRLTDAAGQGMPWIWIDFHTQDGSKYYGTFSDENGNYSLTVAPSQNYIGVIWGGKGQYRTTFYRNAVKESETTLIAVGTNDVGNIDFMLDAGAKVSGTVAGLASGEKIRVSVWSESTGSMGGAEVTGTGDGTTPRTFEIAGLVPASDYRLDWRGSSEEIPNGYYGGTPTSGTSVGPVGWEKATRLNTTNGNVTGVGIDLAKVTGKSLHVQVTGLPANAWVDANAWSEKLDNGRWKRVQADGSGSATFEIKGLDASGDDYRLFIGGPETAFKVGTFNGESGTTTYPTQAGTLVGWDRATLLDMANDRYVKVAVSTGYTLTVTVTGLASGQKAWVDAISETTGAHTGGSVVYGNGTSDQVVLKGLDAADDYRVSIWGEQILGGTYAGVGKSLGAWDKAELVDLSQGDGAITFSVTTGKTISGTVSGLKSNDTARIDAWSESTWSWSGTSLKAGSTGSESYAIQGVGLASDFKVSFNADAYLPQSQSNVDTTTANATGVNFTASTGGSIISAVKGLNANEWARVDAWSPGGNHLLTGGVTADANGTGSYILKGVPTADDYAVSLWRGNKGIYFARSGVTPSWSEHTPVSVSGVTATTGIDFDLSAANSLFFTLSGTVSGLSADQMVEIHAWSDKAGATTSLTGNGSFKLEGLPSGNYTVEVTSTGYAPQRTGGVTVANGVVTQIRWTASWKSVGTVALTQDTTGLNVALSKGYALKGTVTRSGAAVDGVLVNIWSDADNVGGSAVTNSKGEFTVKGLPNATYRVDVWTPDGSASNNSVTVNGADVSAVNLVVTKASGAILVKMTEQGNAVAGNALVLAYEQGVEKERCVTDQGSGSCTLDGLTVGTNYTIKVFGSNNLKAGNWSTSSGYCEGTANATNPATTVELQLN
ncbi:hypothetical protein SIID45300_03039 [Candidatus Magnetaquicoccaceae bacterium FCR-1]|uniref:Tandem-95 repeat protein n=1 Tax=Candidatus Magnetaquiglobus chichijimensis TaxID=3141448 RepID=A0ABQ0CDB8_9PROT